MNARIEAAPLKKVGLSFNSNESIENVLNDFDDNSIVLTSLDEEFQKFIDSMKE
ncbi:hypothetical protein [Bacteriovorax sp. DB6_IX]|uniref:hypothetical protein n=1 Tax=Bacteriovorax sp. DB6_IX TaxID=1353530 RepID=UPI00038A09BA|nr:hypothetical protein [Bacteriovorax sp. DB6_IX]EQC51266.1 hypothetical protein M901_1101 [Bacteriovorax sp. DB6_IX]